MARDQQYYENTEETIDAMTFRAVNDCHVLKMDPFSPMEIRGIVQYWVDKMLLDDESNVSEFIDSEEYKKAMDDMSEFEFRIYLRVIHTRSCEHCRLLLLCPEVYPLKPSDISKEDDLDIDPPALKEHANCGVPVLIRHLKPASPLHVDLKDTNQ